MQDFNIPVPSHLMYDKTLDFINSFKDLRETKNYIFDFKILHRIDSFSLLCLSSELQLFKANNPESTFQARNFQQRTYEAHMGFFKSFGLNYGKTPGQARHNNNYIPITIYSVRDIKNQAKKLMIHPGEYLTNMAESKSKVLTRNGNPTLGEILTYCIREIFRNIVEHSETERFGFCAQYLPSKNIVEFAVLDRGMGLRNSLAGNPRLSITSDLAAINEGLKPGISGKIYPGQKNKPKGDWANSGYGLYMTSNICTRGGGSFFLASNSAGLLISENSSRSFDLNLTGTGLILTLNTQELKSLDFMLKDFRENLPKNIPLKASNSTMNRA